MLTEKQLGSLSGHCEILSTVRQEDDEEAWLKVRLNGIGGSDVGAICGVNNWSSAKQIYFRKIGMYQDETEPSEAAKARMHFGHVLEPVVAKEFIAQHEGLKEVEADITFKSTKVPYLLANVDRFIINAETDEIVGILECKTANENMNFEWNAGEVPISYYYQVQHYMFVTGIHRAWISCLVGGNKFYTYDIFFDSDLYTRVILPQLDNFWNNCVLKLQEPEAMAADSKFYDELFSPSSVVEEPVNFDDEMDKHIANLQELKAKKKELEKQINNKLAVIKAAMGEHVTAYAPSFEVKWDIRSRTSVDSNKLRMNYPEIYEECCNTTSYRQMTIKATMEVDI